MTNAMNVPNAPAGKLYEERAASRRRQVHHWQLAPIADEGGHEPQDTP